ANRVLPLSAVLSCRRRLALYAGGPTLEKDCCIRAAATLRAGRRRRKRSAMSKARWRSFRLISTFLFLLCVSLHAQSQLPSDSLPRTTHTPSGNPNDSLPPSNDATSSSYGNSPYAPSTGQRQRMPDADWSLSASRILDLIQQRPEIAVELK